MPCIHARQNGFAILIMLVAVVILMLLYFVQIDTLFGPGLPAEAVGIEERPWLLEDLLAPDGEDIKLPGKSKLQLDEPFSLTVPVRRKEADRGEVTILFEPNGHVRAKWEAAYQQSERNYHLQAQAGGNIHAKRTYQDAKGKDKSRLFFIARGRYTKTSPDKDATSMGETGTVWLTGWIRPDRSAQGHLTLTTKRQWAAAYAFETAE